MSLFLTTTGSLYNYLCLPFKLPLSLYQSTTVSPSNYLRLFINVADNLTLRFTPYLSLSNNPYIPLFFFQLPQSVFQTIASSVSLSNYHCLTIWQSLSLPQTTSVSLSMSLAISLHGSHHTCPSFLQPLPLSVFQTTTVSLCNYLCFCFKKPLFLFQTTTVSLSNYCTSACLSNYYCLY